MKGEVKGNLATSLLVWCEKEEGQTYYLNLQKGSLCSTRMGPVTCFPVTPRPQSHWAVLVAGKAIGVCAELST